MTDKGFYIELSFLYSQGIRDLTINQIGILTKIYSILASGKSKKWWGFLVDHEGNPLSERRIRYYLGNKSMLPHKTWLHTKNEFIKRGIFKTVKTGDTEYIMCPSFIKANDFSKKEAMREEPRIGPGTEYFLGYDPEKEPETTWDKLCKRWLELIGKTGKIPRPPLSHEMGMKAKLDAKKTIIKMADNMGIDEALHDMGIAFEYKKMQGGKITSLFYFICRWRSKDWMSRHSGLTNKEKESETFKIMVEEAKLRIQKGTIKNKEDLRSYFKGIDEKTLNNLSNEVGLE